jgi:protein-L-isoaspartate(D-aspartate) O-methyltransferase
MVETQLAGRGIRDARVLEAMRKVPRHRFLPPERVDLAYADQAVPLELGQTISQPYVVAAMTEALRIGPEDRVLEVGTGSGYQAAVLAHLADVVYTVERIGSLAATAERLLGELGLGKVHVRVGDGSLGWPEHAPYDAIVVTAAAPSVPPALRDQLSDDGGRLVAPVGGPALQQLTRYVREGTTFVSETLMGCRFVPLVEDDRSRNGGPPRA